MNRTQEIISECFEVLPQDLKDLVLSSHPQTVVDTISRKHNLLPAQADDLFDETILVLFGLKYSKDYIRNLSKTLDVPTQTVHTIAHEVNEQLFKGVRDSLLEIQQNESEGKTETPPLPKPPETEGVNVESPKADGGTSGSETMSQETKIPLKFGGFVGSNVEKQTTSDGQLTTNNLQRTTNTVPKPLNIIDEKLNSVVKLPKEERVIDTLQQPKKPGYGGNDPYREPFN